MAQPVHAAAENKNLNMERDVQKFVHTIKRAHRKMIIDFRVEISVYNWHSEIITMNKRISFLGILDNGM